MLNRRVAMLNMLSMLNDLPLPAARRGLDQELGYSGRGRPVACFEGAARISRIGLVRRNGWRLRPGTGCPQRHAKTTHASQTVAQRRGLAAEAGGKGIRAGELAGE